MTTATKLDAATLESLFRNAAGFRDMPEGWTPVGAWVRVSSGGQDEANQVPQIMGYCVEHNYWVKRWYVVHAKSAYHGKQQEYLDQALADMRAGETSVLVIWHSDRIERRPGKALLDVLVEFGDAGGRVESAQEPTLGKLDFSGQVTTFVAGLVNHEKSKHIADQVKLAQDRIRANGATGNRVPWGYTTEGPKYARSLVPTELGRKYVPEIFQRCIDGDSTRTIAAWLDSMGVPTMTGKRWHEGSIRHLLRNRTYACRRTRRNDTDTYQRCDAVITMDIFERANEALRNRPKRGPVVKDPEKRPMLAKLRCYRCDSPMYRIKAGDGTNRTYYRCFGSGPQRKGCGNRVPYLRTETMVAVRFLAWNDKPYQIRKWVTGKTWDAEIAEVMQDIQELVQDPLADGFLERMAEKQTELADYTERNKNREKGHYEYTDVLNDDGSVKTIGQYFYDLDDDGRREYLKTHDIRAERTACCGGVRVVMDGREDVVHEAGCSMAGTP